MSNVLFLAHRLPYPPNKGDKLRSYRLLRHLAQRHRVFLGTFIDDPADLAHVETVRAMCAGFHVERIHPSRARVRSLTGLLTGEALTLPYYRSPALQAWVDRTIAAERIDTALLFSSPMVQYVDRHAGVRRLVDFVDVDSAKWTQYAESRRWPMSWVYRREGKRLLAYEAASAARADAAFFVTDAEVDLFRHLAPGAAGRVECIGMGVDGEYFSPHRDYPSPFAPGEVPVVFTGAMDYWPNADAARWFAEEVLPHVMRRHSAVRFYVVGMRPTAAVRALAGADVVVTGSVPDIRPYIHHATVCVAPLRIARGIQSKVLEAMAMAKAVVTTDTCAAAIDARPGRDFATAATADDFAARIVQLLQRPDEAREMGEAARKCVLAKYTWDAQLRKLDAHVDTPQPAVAVPA